MLDKILDNKIDFDSINKNNARDLFYYSYINNVDVSDIILKTRDYRYISLYLKHNNDIDKSKFIEFILSNISASYIYNVWFDNASYLDKTDLFLKRLIELNDEKYIIKLLMNYFIVLHCNDTGVINITKEYLKCEECSIKTKIIFNYKKQRKKFKIKNKDFTAHCFKGHDDEIPSIIVLHSCDMYEKAIYNFYDENSDVSSHFVVGRHGYYKQVVSLDDSAWGNGTSLNENSDVYYKLAKNEIIKSMQKNANYFTFSIENETMDGSLTEVQYQTTLMLIKKIINYLKNTYNYDFKIDENHIIGHSDVNPIVRTKCPGELFPIKRIINDLKYNNKVDYLMLVNKEHMLNEDYFPIDLVEVENRKGDNPNKVLLLNSLVAKKFKELQKCGLENNFDIICDSAYRSIDIQKKLIDIRIRKNESLDTIALPGASEHHTGLCLDVAGIINGKYTDNNEELSDIYEWLKDNAHKFGFIIRYQKGKENITGFPSEPWHIRYVGENHAKIIYDEDLTLEEYLIKYNYLNND